MPFTPLMTREAKLQIERKSVEVLGELYGSYKPVNKIEPEDEDWLRKIGVNTIRDPVHDAAGINDDYPTGRGIFIEDGKEFVVLINFEDHIEIVMTPPNKDRNLKKCFTRLIKLNSTFEKIGFSSDPYLGSLTASPRNLGTGLSLSG